MNLLDHPAIENTAPAATAPLVEGRRKVVTMLFADIVNSSSMVIGRDPEAANASLLPVLQSMIDAVHQYGGTVLQVLGDGIMATFGAPDAQEDHALRACLAAHRMRAEIDAWPAVGALARSLAIRVGINSGEILAQELLADRWPEYRAAGEAVYIAARMTEAAKPGVVLLSAETRRLVGDAARLGGKRMVSLGKQLPRATAYELAGIDLDALRTAKTGTPFVGRARERGLLDQVLKNVISGRGHMTVVHGDPGIGKTRLASEFAADARAAGHAVIRTACFPPHLFVPTPPVVEALRQALGLINIVDADGIDAATGLTLNPLHRAAAKAMLGAAVNDAQWNALGPQERRHLMLSSCVEFFDHIARTRGPLVVILEDVHWADSDLSRLIDLISVRVHQQRQMVVMTRRHGTDQQDTPWPSTTVIDIDPLSAEESVQLARDALGDALHLRALGDLLVEKTGGNPFFLLECIAAVAPSERTNAAAIQNWVREFAVPRTIQSVIAARIAGLQPSDQELLCRASVIGQTFACDLLGRIIPDRREHLLAALNRLVQAGFLQRTRVVPNLEFSFKHALIHDVAYGSLPRAVRRSLHSSLAAALRSKSCTIPNRLALLAQHCYRSEQWAKAVVFGLVAGRDALRRSQHREASALLESSLDALSQFDCTPRNLVRAAKVRIELANAVLPLGRRDDAERHLKAAEAAAKRSGNERVLTSAWCSLTLHHWVAGNLPVAYRIGRRALAHAEEKGYADLGLISIGRLGSIAMELGRGRAARGYLEKALTISEQTPGRAHAGFLVVAPVVFQGPLAVVLSQLGQFREAIALADSAVAAAEEAGHLFTRVYALFSAGTVYLNQGDFERSAHLLGQALRLSRTIGATLLIRQIVSAMGYSLLHLGRAEEGCALLADSVASATPDPMVGQLPQHLSWLALAKVSLGDHEGATVVARRAISLARRNSQKGYEAWGWYALSRAQGAQDARISTRAMARARSISAACGLRPLVARTETGWGPAEAIPSNAGAAIAEARPRRHLRLVSNDDTNASQSRSVVLT